MAGGVWTCEAELGSRARARQEEGRGGGGGGRTGWGSEKEDPIYQEGGRGEEERGWLRGQ
jgi:hypothetical protein